VLTFEPARDVAIGSAGRFRSSAIVLLTMDLSAGIPPELVDLDGPNAVDAAARGLGP